MKKLFLHRLFTIVVISSIIFSCQKKQIGFFNNHNPVYKQDINTAKENEEKAAAELEASTEPGVATITSTPSFPVIENTKETKKATQEASKQTTEIKSKKLSKIERKQIKDKIKKTSTDKSGAAVVILVILAIILPPLAVLLVDGLKGPFWLSILLTLLFYLPGLIYALWRIFKD